MAFGSLAQTVANTVAPGAFAFDARAAVQQRQAGDLRLGLLLRGKEAGDVGEDRMVRAVGRERGQERIGALADLAAAQDHRQDVAQRRARVSARPEAS